MINLLNHNTSYKHSKFSARPTTSIYCDHRILSKLVHFTKTQMRSPSFYLTSSVFKNPSIKSVFEYQSKPLLCWRYDSLFFNLQGFFFSILKALHTCWCYVKNNKKIVFVSTDNPFDTGHSGLTDQLTQTFAREFLPRIQTLTPLAFAARAKAKAALADQRNSKSSSTPSRTPSVVSLASQSTFRPKTQNKRAASLKKNTPTVLRGTLKKNKKREKNKSVRALINAHKQINILSELKNVINISTKPQREHEQEEASNDQTSFSTHYVYHNKLAGLLFRAASRRLSSSFSRLPTPFFSNAKASFQEKVSHLSFLSLAQLNEDTFNPSVNKSPSVEQKKNSNFPTATESTKRFKSKKLWFNLNHTSSLGYFREKLAASTYTQKKANKKTRKIRSFVRIFQQRPQNVNVREQPTKGRGFKKKPFGKGINIKSPTPKKKFAYEFLPIHSSANTDHKMRRQSAFNCKYRALRDHRQSVHFRKQSRAPFRAKGFWRGKADNQGKLTHRRGFTTWAGNTRGFQNQAVIKNKHSKSAHGKRRNTPQMTRARQSSRQRSRQLNMGWHHQGANSTRTFVSDFYGTHIRLKAYERTKKFAFNPYIQQADLVFFVNPDKNPGLASQIQKLGIPSIGIVSGLKSTAYRKQPHYSNLHDSVTYPIVGNPDNLLFVMMVVRIFVRLIDRVQHHNKLLV